MLKTAAMYLKRTKSLDAPTDLYHGQLTLLDGTPLDLSELRGKPTLVVNTASKCGFTPQFDGLQKLYETYGPRGLQVVGCSSADFAGQELDTAAEVGEFCRKNYGVTFPVTETISVRADPHPWWAELNGQPGSKPPGWNFTKYLIDADGKFVARFSTKTDPQDEGLVAAIERLLPAAA